jgi:hypothetical protein
LQPAKAHAFRVSEMTAAASPQASAGVRKGAAIASKLELVQRMSNADRVSRKTKDESRNPRKLAAHLSIDLRKRPAIPPWLGIGVGCR